MGVVQSLIVKSDNIMKDKQKKNLTMSFFIGKLLILLQEKKFLFSGNPRSFLSSDMNNCLDI